MTDLEPVTLIEMAAELVAAYVARNHVRAAELPALIATVHASLSGMGSAPEAPTETAKPTPAVPIKKSVTDDYIISLETGQKFKALKRHLAGLGMTPAEYRAKWGLPKDYPMVAPAYAAARSALAKTSGLGRKAGEKAPQPAPAPAAEAEPAPAKRGRKAA